MVATHDVVYYASFLITVPFCHGSSGSRSSYLRYIRAITSLGSSIIPLSGVSLTKNSSKDPPYVTDVTLIPWACSSQRAKIINHETIKVTKKQLFRFKSIASSIVSMFHLPSNFHPSRGITNRDAFIPFQPTRTRCPLTERHAITFRWMIVRNKRSLDTFSRQGREYDRCSMATRETWPFSISRFACTALENQVVRKVMLDSIGRRVFKRGIYVLNIQKPTHLTHCWRRSVCFPSLSPCFRRLAFYLPFLPVSLASSSHVILL